MTHREDIKNKLENGWFFQEIHYDKPNIKVYQLTKPIIKTERETSYTIGQSSLKQFPNAIIKKAKKKTIALNFPPRIPKEDCAIT